MDDTALFMEQNRRTFLLAAGGVGTAMTVSGCLGDDNGDDDGAQDGSEAEYPEPGRDINAWVPFSTGGGYDWYVRTLAEYIPRYLPNEPNMVVDNVTGGTGMAAANQLWRAEPDGYTWLLRILSGNIVQEIAQPDQVQFSNTGFVNACTVAVTPIGWGRTQEIDPFDDWEAFADVVTSEQIGTPGATNDATVIAVILGALTGEWEMDDLEFVHYEGHAELMAAMDRNEVNIGTSTASSIVDFTEPDGIQMSVTIADEGTGDGPALTDWETPFDAEEVVEPFRLARPISFPPETPDSVVDTFVPAVEEALNDDELLAEAEEGGRDITFMGREETEATVEAFEETWTEFEDILIELYE